MVELIVNGKKMNVDAGPEESLLHILRDHIELTGTKYGCGEGSCGSCTVLVNGTAVRSCTVRAATLGGKEITTIEGLEVNGQLHPVQKACLEVDVFQCSYCASGMILSAVSLLGKKPNPSRQEIVEWMQGNICRCGTYSRIIKAIQLAANA